MLGLWNYNVSVENINNSKFIKLQQEPTFY